MTPVLVEQLRIDCGIISPMDTDEASSQSYRLRIEIREEKVREWLRKSSTARLNDPTATPAEELSDLRSATVHFCCFKHPNQSFHCCPSQRFKNLCFNGRHNLTRDPTGCHQNYVSCEVLHLVGRGESDVLFLLSGSGHGCQRAVPLSHSWENLCKKTQSTPPSLSSQHL